MNFNFFHRTPIGLTVKSVIPLFLCFGFFSILNTFQVRIPAAQSLSLWVGMIAYLIAASYADYSGTLGIPAMLEKIEQKLDNTPVNSRGSTVLFLVRHGFVTNDIKNHCLLNDSIDWFSNLKARMERPIFLNLLVVALYIFGFERAESSASTAVPSYFSQIIATAAATVQIAYWHSVNNLHIERIQKIAGIKSVPSASVRDGVVAAGED